MRCTFLQLLAYLPARLRVTDLPAEVLKRCGVLCAPRRPVPPAYKLQPYAAEANVAAAANGGGGGPSSLEHAAAADGAAEATASCGSTDGGTTEPEQESEPEQAAEPAPAPPTPALTTDSAEGLSAAKRACSACTLETEDAAQAKCEACGCELDPPPSSATRRKPDTAAGPVAAAAASPHKKNIQSFFAKETVSSA